MNEIFLKNTTDYNTMDKNIDCNDVVCATNSENEIKELLRLSGIKNFVDNLKYDNNICHNKDCTCDCHKSNKEFLQYNLEDFSNELRSTFDSNNFENWLDCLKNFRLKLINKGFSPEASDRIVVEILINYYKKKNNFKNCETSFQKDLNNIHDKENEKDVFNTAENEEKELKDILRLSGLIEDDSNIKNKKVEEENGEKGIYMLELNLKNKDMSENKKIFGKVKLAALNKEDLEDSIDMLINYMKEMKTKGLNKSDFKFVKNKQDMKECEIVINRSPYLIGDRRIFAPTDLDTLQARSLKQRFAKYGDNSLTYEEEKDLLEEKLKKKFENYKKKK